MKEIYLSKSKKTLLENFLSLSFLQVANYIFPLLTLPYLVRVLKPEKYGLIAFANAFVGYFMILTDYGFHLSAPREISINRDNKQKLSEIFSSVMIIKFFLVLFSLVLMTATIFLFDKFRRDWLLYYLTFGVVLGNVMFPTWFFQGIENMKFITLLNLIAKLIFTVSIFVFVRKQADYYFVPLLNSLGFIVAGILSIFIVIKNFGVKFIIPVREQILHQLKEGWHVFISTVAVSLYTTSNTFILGLFTDRKNVAYFAAGEKIVRSIQSLWSPVSQVLYPYFSKVFAVSLDKATQSFRKILNFTFLLTLLISILGCLSAPFFVKFLLGQDFENAIPVVRILI
ncbi:MAG: flippase, partial [Endomicrobiia bacterium]